MIWAGIFELSKHLDSSDSSRAPESRLLKCERLTAGGFMTISNISLVKERADR